ncbi:MAG: hypothetical protein WCJ99_01480 [Betaproteobacteria bacterium]
MIDWINAVLRTVMCLGFLLLVVRPMLLAFSRKEVDRLAIEDAAQSSVNSAFNAWRIHNGRHYYDNPEYAEMMASNPNLELPDLTKPAPKTQAVEEVPTVEVPVEAPVETPVEPPVEEVAVEQALAEVAQVAPEAAPAQDEVVSPEENEEDDPVKAMKARLAAEKKKSKPPSIPPELMNNANSFDDKLMLVQMIVQQEQGRVAGVLKKMIQGG